MMENHTRWKEFVTKHWSMWLDILVLWKPNTFFWEILIPLCINDPLVGNDQIIL